MALSSPRMILFSSDEKSCNKGFEVFGAARLGSGVENYDTKIFVPGLKLYALRPQNSVFHYF